MILSLDSLKHRTHLNLYLIFFLLFLLAPSVWAMRPLSTDDAGTVERGQFQFELGFDLTREDNHDRVIAPSLTVSYGVLERMDVGIASSYLFLHPKEGKKEKGLGDTELKLKFRILDEKDMFPAFALTGKIKIPTASDSKGLGSGKTDWSLNTIFTKNLSQKWVLHLNLGYTWIGEHGVNNELSYSVAAQFILSDQWSLVGEMVGVNNFDGRKGNDPISTLFGIYYLIRENIVWDMGLEIGMNKAASDFRLTTGLTLLFKPE
jgi:hypothetical protein